MIYKDRALAHVRKVCSELMELSFGCAVKVKNKSFPNGYLTHIYGLESVHATDNIKAGRYITSDFGAIEEGTYKIIGHTPHLEHWLRGIDKVHKEFGDPLYSISSDGELCGFNYLLHVDEGVCEYDLTKDGNSQSEDFYKAYCEIVGA